MYAPVVVLILVQVVTTAVSTVVVIVVEQKWVLIPAAAVIAILALVGLALIFRCKCVPSKAFLPYLELHSQTTLNNVNWFVKVLRTAALDPKPSLSAFKELVCRLSQSMSELSLSSCLHTTASVLSVLSFFFVFIRELDGSAREIPPFLLLCSLLPTLQWLILNLFCLINN